MSALEFHDAPPPRRYTVDPNRTSKYKRIAVELRAHPGRWAKVAERKSSRGSGPSIRKALGPGFRVVTRKNDAGGLDVWASYVGEEPTP